MNFKKKKLTSYKYRTFSSPTSQKYAGGAFDTSAVPKDTLGNPVSTYMNPSVANSYAPGIPTDVLSYDASGYTPNSGGAGFFSEVTGAPVPKGLGYAAAAASIAAPFTGTGKKTQNPEGYGKTYSTSNSYKVVEGVKDGVGAVFPIAGAFRAVQKVGRNIGPEGSEVQAGFAGVFDPLTEQLDTLTSKHTTGLEKGVAIALPPLSGFMAKAGRDRYNRENRAPTPYVNPEGPIDNSFAYGGPINQKAYGGPVYRKLGPLNPLAFGGEIDLPKKKDLFSQYYAATGQDMAHLSKVNAYLDQLAEAESFSGLSQSSKKSSAKGFYHYLDDSVKTADQRIKNIQAKNKFDPELVKLLNEQLKLPIEKRSREMQSIMVLSDHMESPTAPYRDFIAGKVDGSELYYRGHHTEDPNAISSREKAKENWNNAEVRIKERDAKKANSNNAEIKIEEGSTKKVYDENSLIRPESNHTYLPDRNFSPLIKMEHGGKIHPPNDPTFVAYGPEFVVKGKRIPTNLDDKFLSAREGFKTKLYVPDPKTSNSGVTFGKGIDLGTKDAEYFKYFRGDPEKIKMLEPYFGLTKEDAVNALEKNPLTLDRKTAKELSDYAQSQEEYGLRKAFQDKYGKSLNDLPPEVATALASTTYQMGVGRMKDSNYWRQIAEGDFEGAYNNLIDWNSNGQPSQHQSRRELEANLILKHIQKTNPEFKGADSKLTMGQKMKGTIKSMFNFSEGGYLQNTNNMRLKYAAGGPLQEINEGGALE